MRLIGSHKWKIRFEPQTLAPTYISTRSALLSDQIRGEKFDATKLDMGISHTLAPKLAH